MDKNFGGVIWTNHALDRLKERNIKQGDAWATFNRPDQSRPGSTSGSSVYYKTFGNERLEVVAKKDQGQWIIMSVWMRPLHEGYNDSKRSSGSGWDRFLERLLGKIFRR